MNFDGNQGEHTGYIKSSDGISLHYRYRQIKNHKASVILVHGFAEHSGRYKHLMDRLASERYSVFMGDLRGHGLSEGERGFILSFDEYFNDLLAMVKKCQELFSEGKLFAIAHSMGGLIASLFAIKYPKIFFGIVLSSPAFGMNMAIPWYKSLAGKMMSKIYPRFSLPTSIEPGHLTKDEFFLNQYIQDPLIFRHVTSRLYTEVLAKYDEISDKAFRIRNPLFFQISGRDLVVSSEKTKEIFKNLTAPDRQIKLYHGYLHEIYNEIGREEPISDLLKWLDQR